MAPEISGTGDPARTIATLWGTRKLRQRGPKPMLTTAQVVATAIRIADADADLGPLSIRRVAEDLGVGTMSLYTYIASRDELVDAMLDTVYGEVTEQLGGRRPTDWRDGLRTVALANWELCLRHPWVLQVFTGRPPLGPNALANYERELSTIDGIGLTDVEMDAAITLVHTHVEGLARRRVEADRSVRSTGITDQQWWEAVQPALSEVFDPAQYPVAVRVGEAAGQQHQAAHNPEHAYAFGLDRLIEGIEVLIESNASRRRR